MKLDYKIEVIIPSFGRPFTGTAKAWERRVRYEILKRKIGDRVIRCDYKNGKPDWAAFTGHEMTYHECKRYSSIENVREAMGKWEKSQNKQLKTQLDAGGQRGVYVWLALKDKNTLIKITK